MRIESTHPRNYGTGWDTDARARDPPSVCDPSAPPPGPFEAPLGPCLSGPIILTPPGPVLRVWGTLLRAQAKEASPGTRRK